MAQKKSMPDGLRKQSGQRTDVALSALFSTLRDLRTEVAENRYEGVKLSVAKLMERAGLGEKFLNGPKHKGETKMEVHNQLAFINGLIEKRKRAEPTTEPSELELARSDAAYWKGRFQKLAGQYNLAFIRIRELQRTAKDDRIMMQKEPREGPASGQPSNGRVQHGTK